jgi:hypothetical protein
MGERYQRLRLADGRWLSYRELGDSRGQPVMYFHGTPSSSAEIAVFGSGERFASRGLRVVALDRPGSGGSSFLPARRILDWPGDVVSLADHLDLGRCGVLLRKGPVCPRLCTDHPHAPDGSGDVQRNQPLRGSRCTRRDRGRLAPVHASGASASVVSRAVSTGMGALARFAPSRLIAQAKRSLPPPDSAALEDPELAATFARMVQETTHGSARGGQHDTALLVGS